MLIKNGNVIIFENDDVKVKKMDIRIKNNIIEEISENINYYKKNANIIAETLKKHNIWFTGGIHSPYIWLKCPSNMTSWDFFDFLLEKAAIVGTPGAGFGKNGEGFFRLTSFNTNENTKEAMERLDKIL